MKTKILVLLAAMLLFSATTVMAQSDNTESEATETALNGDVNGDGIVDVADIAAVIAVMKAQGSIETKYYWYVGQTNPADMTSISPIVTDTSSPGWRLIGTSIPSYTINNPLWDGATNPITTGSTKQIVYALLPNSTLKLRDGDGNIFDSWENTGTKEIAGVKYYIYQSPATLKTFVLNIF